MTVRLIPTLVAAILMAALGASAGASRGSPPAPCWKELVGEWYAGMITTIYPLRCYAQALDHLPRGALVLAQARHDIRAAEIAAEHGKAAPREESPSTSARGSSPTTRRPPPSRPDGRCQGTGATGADDGPTLLPCTWHARGSRSATLLWVLGVLAVVLVLATSLSGVRAASRRRSVRHQTG